MPVSALDTIELRDLPPQRNGWTGLPEIPGGWTERSLRIGSHWFRLVLPAAPDDFLDDPAIHAAYDRSEYMPYWAFLWPSAIHMATAILRQPWVAGTLALELGAGVGLVGLAACQVGLDLNFTDYDPTSVDLCLFNARRNGFTRARGQVLDWQTPSEDTYPVILCSDGLYEERNHAALIAVMQQMLTCDGVAWFGDGGRVQVVRFCERLSAAGFNYRLFDQEHDSIPAPRIGTYQLIEVRKSAAKCCG